ncbi:MAG: hypothetical protein ACKOWF_04140 [Chloroflexota bacterium]
MDAIHLVVFFLGAVLVGWSCLSAIRAFMIPGAQHHLMGRLVFRGAQALFLAIGRMLPAGERGPFYSLYGPIGLLGVYALAMVLIGIGFGAMFWAVARHAFSMDGLASALIDSGSALSTLGFTTLTDVPRSLLSVLEALAATTVSALLIGYLPVIFSAYLATEQTVADLEAETGGARCGVEVLIAIERSRNGDDLWKSWTRWFSRVGKHHGSLVGNMFMRAPETHTSWVAAAGSVLDAAALRQAAVAGPADPAAAYCLATGSAAAERATHFLGFDSGARAAGAAAPGPRTDRAGFDAACDLLAAAGVPLRADREAAWTEFAALRDAYIRQMVTLAGIKATPLSALDCGRAVTPDPVAVPVRRGRPLANPAGFAG